MLKRTTATLAVFAALAGWLLTGCQGEDTSGCNETCEHDKDTLTIKVAFLRPTPEQCKAKPTPEGEVTWTKGGHQQYSGSHLTCPAGKLYTAYVHGWRKQGRPRVSVTGDENVHAGVACTLYLTPEKGFVPELIATERRGERAEGGSVTCNTDGAALRG